jgi:protein-S-isoprenylcysteine O-methyltransferase Ste14
MYIFLVPLLLGFAFNWASAFTAAFSRRLGDRRGSALSAILRDVLGIPVWAIGFVLAIRAPSPVLVDPTVVTKVSGWSMVSVGGLIILIALATIRLRAAAPSTRDALAQSGIYAIVRHPIHTGTLLEFLGLLLLKPMQTTALACLLGFVFVLVQSKLEEIDLLQRLPGYGEYMKKVPRYLPWIL